MNCKQIVARAGVVFAVMLGCSAVALGQSGTTPLNRTKTMLKPSRSAAPTAPRQSPLNRTSKLGSMMRQNSNGQTAATSAPGTANDSGAPSAAVSRESLDDASFASGVYRPQQSVLDLTAHPGQQAEIGGIFRTAEKPLSSDDLRASLVDSIRNKTLTSPIEQVRDIVAQRGEDDANLVKFKQQLIDDHFMEVRLSPDYTAMIRAKGWCDVYEAAQQLREQYGLSECPPHNAYDNAWQYVGDYMGRHSDDIVYGLDTYPTSQSDDTASAVRDRGSVARQLASASMKDAFLAGVGRQADQTHTRKLSALESGLSLLQQGEFAEAASSLSTYVGADTEDAEAVRLCGIAKMLAGQVAEGIAFVSRAYLADSSLCDTPLDPAILPDADRAWRNVTQRVVTLAHASKSADASFVAAVLLQAQSKPEAALRMLDKAKDKGLGDRLEGWMRVALSPGAK
ncbi:MAG: hypothetical protein AB7G11_00770 [Phycisphaerales bacterium]